MINRSGVYVDVKAVASAMKRMGFDKKAIKAGKLYGWSDALLDTLDEMTDIERLVSEAIKRGCV